MGIELLFAIPAVVGVVIGAGRWYGRTTEAIRRIDANLADLKDVPARLARIEATLDAGSWRDSR